MSKTFTQSITFDAESGEVYSDKIFGGSENGKGWVIMYADKVLDLMLNKMPSASVLKVFMYLSLKQEMNCRGVITTKKQVQELLGVTKPTCLEAFKWLKENGVITESKVNGVTEFFVNPAYVTIGKKKSERIKEWNNRNHGFVMETSSEDVVPSKRNIKKIRSKSIRRNVTPSPNVRSIVVE